MNKLEKKGIRILNEARTLGRAKTRDELKRQGIAFKAVTSPRSMEIHEGNWKEFSKWASDEGYKSLKKIDEDVIKKFLIEKSLSGGRSGNGASVKTLKSYITSINKVMSAGNLWTDEDKIKCCAGEENFSRNFNFKAEKNRIRNSRYAYGKN